LVAAALLLGAGLAYGPHVVNGGFAVDDWIHAAAAHHASSIGELLTFYWGETAYRPLLVVYVPLSHSILGTEPWGHHALSLVLATWVSTALYAVLRRLSIPRPHALTIALLVLLFPWSDSIRLWATAGHISLGIALMLTGVALALRGLDALAAGATARGRRFHVAAIALYAASVLTYEVAGTLLLLVGVLYLGRAPWPVVWRRWLVDAAAVVACLLWNYLSGDRFDRLTGGEMVDHAQAIVEGGATVLALAAVPAADATALVLSGIAAVLVAAAAWARRARDGDLRAQLRRWLLVAGSGLTAMAASWLLYVPAPPYYQPLQPGIGNRVNALAAIGIVLVAYAAIVLAATMAARLLPRWRHAATVLSLSLAALVAVGYVDRVRVDLGAWARAAAVSDQALAAIETAVPSPAPGTTIYNFGQPGNELPGVPILGANLQPALQVLYDDASVTGYPVLEGAAIGCRRTRMTLVGPGLRGQKGARYGQAYFVDTPSASARPIDSRAACVAASRQFRPGPIVRGETAGGATATAASYRLAGDGEALVDAAGTRIPIDAERVTGYIDSTRRTSDVLLLSGWAATAELSRPADVVVALIDGDSVTSAVPTARRDDLVDGYDRPELERAGFAFTVPETALDASCTTPSGSIEVFAIAGDAAGPLGLPAIDSCRRAR
jgi:hypothetical protein